MKQVEISLNELTCTCQSCLNKSIDSIRSIDSVKDVEINKNLNKIVLSVSNDDIDSLRAEILKNSAIISKNADFCFIDMEKEK